MTSEFNPCRKDVCYVHKLLDMGYVALWPQSFEPESGEYVGATGVYKVFSWNLYVKWTPSRGSNRRRVFFCEKHHKQILDMFEREGRQDVEEQEATQSWMIRNGGRL